MLLHLRRTLVGCGLIAMAVGFLGGCEEGPGAEPTHVLNPPSWIHGTWVYCDPTLASLVDDYWKFSAHNVEHRSSGIVLDYTEWAKAARVTISDDHGEGWYSLDLGEAAHRFTRHGLRLDWTSTSFGASTTLPICRS